VPPDPETITILDQHRELEKMGHARSGGGGGVTRRFCTVMPIHHYIFLLGIC